MDGDERSRANPYGMDEDCRRCEGLPETRERVVHGYGDVAADFMFVGEAPTAESEAAGVPLVGGEGGETVQHVLGLLGLSHSLPSATRPEVENVYLTYLARCRHPERPPTDTEVANCEVYRNADTRMVNPEVIVPVGERALAVTLEEHTRWAPDEYTFPDAHAQEIRGRGFAVVPMLDPAEQTDAETEAFVDAFEALMARDYRQTKGRQER